jgi:T-complex protein 1 subunit theta
MYKLLTQSTEVISNLYASHNSGSKHEGVDIEHEGGSLNAMTEGIYDVASVKESAIKQATHVAITLLSVDQIIMSKQAGGPKAPKQNNDWDED